MMSPAKGLMVQRTKTKILMTILIALVVSISNHCSADEMSYRIVSSCKENGQTRTYRNIVRNGSNDMATDSNFIWKAETDRIWLPNIPKSNFEQSIEMPFVVEDNRGLPIQSVLEVSMPVIVELSHRRTLQYVFSIKGFVSQRSSGDEPDDATTKLKDIGAKSVALEGDGFVLVDAKTGRPIAGYAHLSRKLLPELWRNNDPDEKLTSEIERAWAEIF